MAEISDKNRELHGRIKKAKDPLEPEEEKKQRFDALIKKARCKIGFGFYPLRGIGIPSRRGRAFLFI